MRRWRETLAVAALAAAHAALAAGYGWLTPAWEANDEIDHAADVEYVAAHGAMPPLRYSSRFPVPGTIVARRIDWHETHQPPVYYFLAAGWQRLFGIEPFEPDPPERSSWRGEDPPRLVYDHAYSPAQREQAAALHRLRLLSALIGAATVVLIYAAARVAFGRADVALGAAAFTAFLPKFIVVSGVVSNDGLVILLCTVALLLLLLHLRGGAGRLRWVLPLTLGAVAATAIMTKLNAAPCAVVILATLAAAGGGWRRRLGDLALFIAGFSAVSGWWVTQNIGRYGEVVPGNVGAAWVRSLLPGLVEPVSWLDRERFLHFLPRSLLRSMWYTGGWNQFAPPMGLSAALFGVALVGLFGAARAAWRRRLTNGGPLDLSSGLVLFGWALAGLAAVVIIAKYTVQAESRIAYVGLGGFAPLVVLGLCELAGGRGPGRILALAFWPVSLAALDVYVLLEFVLPFAGL